MRFFKRDNKNTEEVLNNNKKSSNVTDEELTDISKNIQQNNSSKKSDKMEEIYSTKDKHIRYKRVSPLEAEEKHKTRETRKQELKSGSAEIKLEDTGEIDNIELKAELENDMSVADDIISDIGKFQDIHSFVKDGQQSEDKYQSDVETAAELPSLSKAEKVINTVAAYQHESKVKKIIIKAGRFTEVVESEYDQYLMYNSPTRPKQIVDNIPENKSLIYHLSQFANKYKGESKNEEEKQKKKRDIEEDKVKRSQTDENVTPESDEITDEDIIQADERTPKPIKKKTVKQPVKKKEGFLFSIGKFFRVLVAVIGSMFISKESKKITQETGPIDYEERQDAKYVFLELKKNIKSLMFLLFGLIIILLLLSALSILESIQGEQILSQYTSYGPIIFCASNLILLLISGFIYRKKLILGLKALRKIKGNADSAISIAYIVCMIQAIVSMFLSSSFAGGNHHLYALIVVFAMMLNTLGRLFIEYRVKSNFKFITSKTPAFAAKMYSDEEIAARMLNGTTASHPYAVYQHRTNFLSDFLKISYAPDASEEISGKVSPAVFVVSLVVSIIHLIISKDILSALSSLTVMCCIGIPFSAITAGNLPLLLFSKRLLKHNAMITGYPSVRQFCDSSAIMVKANELYPRGSVIIENTRDMVGLGFEDVMVAAGAVLKEAESPLAGAFHKILHDNSGNVPSVESVMFEERCGIVGWVEGNRVLIGNRNLMEKYHINIESSTVEERYGKRNQSVVFVAFGGRLAAQISVSYIANPTIRENLIRAEENGICIIISSNDVNLTKDKIAEDFELYSKTIKVLSLGYANTCNECMERKEETSRAYVATRGRFSSLCKSIIGCVRLKSNLTMGLMVQIFGIVLGILLCATMSIYAGVARLTVFNILLFIVFWIVATFIAELIRRP